MREFIDVAWDLTTVIGTLAVLVIALMLLGRTVFKGEGLLVGVKKALAVLWRNLP